MTNPLVEEVAILRQNFERENYKVRDYRVALITASHVRLARALVGDWVEDYAGPYSFLDDTPALNGSNRIVFGAHGPYVEFTLDHAEFEMKIPEDQGWRIIYNSYVKYIHKVPVEREEKIYIQVGFVSYADYDIGMAYIDLYALKPTGAHNG